MKTSRSFSSDLAATRSARHFVLHAVGNAPPGLRDAIAVMVGELVMNAVQHAQTGFEVTVELTGGTLRVEVTDSGGNYPAPGPMPPPTSSRGRGLPIVDNLAADWGITWSPPAPGKTVWFEIAVPSGNEPDSAALPAPADC
jgi:anti-sigma regulatory factor (Ser/Thr protein kinase)